MASSAPAPRVACFCHLCRKSPLLCTCTEILNFSNPFSWTAFLHTDSQYHLPSWNKSMVKTEWQYTQKITSPHTYQWHENRTPTLYGQEQSSICTKHISVAETLHLCLNLKNVKTSQPTHSQDVHDQQITAAPLSILSFLLCELNTTFQTTRPASLSFHSCKIASRQTNQSLRIFSA